MALLAQMKLLINLARIDGEVAGKERAYIRNIGLANDLDGNEIEKLFDQRHDLIVPDDLSDDQKFEYIFSLVQLMKIDERMYKEEIMFCSKIASRLGYDEQVMFDLMLHVKAAAMGDDEMTALKKLTKKYL
ncbi:TerB family tellurite resistance protein [Chryseotalea sanaruensis]|uniref:TerB family tellurite resistance protein n=2 Tax=Chryseotalea sanaruensis TaxID=2482724 RepID=A0A401UBD7_9BACT|nr:TerB family tellurite resistance protein [Chryseotalea sanaruensis]